MLGVTFLYPPFVVSTRTWSWRGLTGTPTLTKTHWSNGMIRLRWYSIEITKTSSVPQPRMEIVFGSGSTKHWTWRCFLPQPSLAQNFNRPSMSLKTPCAWFRQGGVSHPRSRPRPATGSCLVRTSSPFRGHVHMRSAK